MNNKVNKKKLSLQEIYGSGPHYFGNPSFDGGFYGFGGDRQIVKKDPQVQKIQDQEEGEVNQNVQDQGWTMGTNNWEKHLNMQDVHTNNIEDQFDLPVTRVTEDRNPADANYTHLPGAPAMNIVPNSKLFVPGAGRPDGTEEYLLDDELEGGYQKEYPPADHSPLGGMGQVIEPKQFIPNDEPDQEPFQVQNHYQESVKKKPKKDKKEETRKINVDKNIKNIKKYLKLLTGAKKANDSKNFVAKMEIELNNLEKKLNVSEESITLRELTDIINEIIGSELNK